MEKRINTGMALLPTTIAKLDATAARLGISRAAVVETLTLQCSDHLLPMTVDPAALPLNHRGTRGKGRRKKQ